MNMKNWWICHYYGKMRFRNKPSPVPLYPPHISYNITCEWNWGSVMRSRQLTTSNMGFPQIFIVIVNVHLCNGTFKQTKIQNLTSLLVLPSTTTSIAKSRTLWHIYQKCFGSWSMFWTSIKGKYFLKFQPHSWTCLSHTRKFLGIIICIISHYMHHLFDF